MKAGDIYKTNSGCEFKIIENGGWDKVLIEFQDKHKYRLNTTRSHVKNGGIKNPYQPIVRGIGYIGVGEFTASINSGYRPVYKSWVGMFERCYDAKYQARCPTYKGCTVHPEWHNFQNYAKWHLNHECYGLGYEIDKDILVLGNKVYSPDTCTLVPSNVNKVAVIRSSPLGLRNTGIIKRKSLDRFLVRMNINGKTEVLGYFETEQEAHLAFINKKAERVRDVAQEYRKTLDDKTLDALEFLAQQIEQGKHYV